MPTSPVVQSARDRVAGVVEAARAAVEPVDRGLGAERLGVGADVRAALRVERADALAEHDRVAARDVVVVERAGQVGLRAALALRRGALAARRGSALTQRARAWRRAPAAGSRSRRRGWPGCPCRRGTGCARRRPAPCSRAPAASPGRLMRTRIRSLRAVAVGVDLRLDPHGLLDRLGEVELRRGGAVGSELQPRRRRLRGGGRGEPEERRDGRERGEAMTHGQTPCREPRLPARRCAKP